MQAAMATSISHLTYRPLGMRGSKILFASVDGLTPRRGGLVGISLCWHGDSIRSLKGTKNGPSTAWDPRNTAQSPVRRGKCWLFIHPQTLQVKPRFKKSLMLKEVKPHCMTDEELRAAPHQAEFEHVLQCPQHLGSAAQLASQMGRIARIYPNVHSSLVPPTLAPVRATPLIPI